MSETCRECRYSKTHGRTLVCRRYPPVCTSPVVSQHPAVMPDDWCGEWMAPRRGAGLPASHDPSPSSRPPRGATAAETHRLLLGASKRRIVSTEP